jgi:phosphatidylserine decarboxylase
MSEIGKDIKLALQYALPHRLISRLIYYVTRVRWSPFKNLFIRQFARSFKVDWSEAERADASLYVHFNDFFTRALKADARPLDPDLSVLLCPADGAISQCGDITQGRILQAKGMHYSAAELLADDELATHFENGSFATVYLSPRDYHRLHMPIRGRLLRTLHVPGRLFSVAGWTAERIPRLFARNERLVCIFETDHGLIAQVLVGAINVSSIETVWSGTVTPPYAAVVVQRDETSQAIELQRGAEMGRFNMGSTVIVLSERRLDLLMHAGQAVRMGTAMARWRD